MTDKNNLVIVEVSGGVASILYQPDYIEVYIIDYDNLEEDGEYSSCPICGGNLKLKGAKKKRTAGVIYTTGGYLYCPTCKINFDAFDPLEYFGVKQNE